jgi:ferredoxin--NADP+ reductase
MPLTPDALRVAIVGAGPSGFYAAETLQKAAPTVRIDLYDRLPTPFGLVRGGVAPDHPKIKSVTRVFDRIAGHSGFRFIGSTTVGLDVSPAELRQHYDAVIYTVGAEADRTLGIPGEQLPGSHSATQFVGWYNGHPDYAAMSFDLTGEAAAVIGLGNVAMDVTRILLSPPDALVATDLAVRALDALRNSRIRRVHVIGRRGPAQAACTTPELRELGEIPDTDVIVNAADLELDPTSAAWLESSGDRTATKNLELFRQWADRGATGASHQIVFHFSASPVALTGNDGVTGIRIQHNALEPDGRGGVAAVGTNKYESIPVDLVFRSVGYRGIAIAGLPFDDRRGVIPNVEGRVVEHVDSHTAMDGIYVAGWIKRGPSGVIGTNKSCAVQSVDHLLADLVSGRITPSRGAPDELMSMLSARGIRPTSWTDWNTIDHAELERGAATGRPREKLTTMAELHGVLPDRQP